MMTLASKSRLFFPLLGLFAAACQGGGSTIDPKGATVRAAGYTEEAMHQTGLALGFTASDSGTVKKVMGASGSSASAVVAPMLGAGMTPAMARALVGPQVTAMLTDTAMPTMMTAEEQFDQIGKQLRQLMEDRLFVDANLESQTGDTAVYLLHPDPTCRPLPADTDPAGTVPPISMSCADDLNKVPFRISVTNDGDGVKMTVLVGPAKQELVTVIVHSDELALQVDLPQAKAASDYINQQLGNGSPGGQYDRLAGKMEWSLTKLGDQKVKAAFSILEALDIASTGSSAVTVAASSPVFAVSGDGITKSATLQLGLGATVVDGTWDPQGLGVANRDLHVSLGGIYGSFQLDDNAHQILVTDAGIGETKVMVRTSTIFDLNLNADSMRRFSGRVVANPDDTVQIEVTPKFDASLAFDYNSVASELSSPPSATIAHDTYSVALLNGGQPAIIQTVKSTDTFGGGIRVVAGTLTLGAASAPTGTVTVNAGQCLSSVTPAPTGTNPFLGQLISGACP